MVNNSQIIPVPMLTIIKHSRVTLVHDLNTGQKSRRLKLLYINSFQDFVPRKYYIYLIGVCIEY